MALGESRSPSGAPTWLVNVGRGKGTGGFDSRTQCLSPRNARLFLKNEWTLGLEVGRPHQ